MARSTIAQLKQRIMDLEAQMPHTATRSMQQIKKCGDDLFASAAVVTIASLGGRVIVGPVAIRDGLSRASIDALTADIKRSMDDLSSVCNKGK